MNLVKVMLNGVDTEFYVKDNLDNFSMDGDHRMGGTQYDFRMEGVIIENIDVSDSLISRNNVLMELTIFSSCCESSHVIKGYATVLGADVSKGKGGKVLWKDVHMTLFKPTEELNRIAEQTRYNWF